MTIVEADEFSALCARGEERRRVSLLLVGPLEVGAKVLVHIDSAIRVLDEQEAAQLDRALDGLAAALRGENFEEAFADLIERGPQLPGNLR
jgi:hydrogenase expression/formation protein HypC